MARMEEEPPNLESTAQQLVLGWHFPGQAVEDQVEVGSSYDGDVEGVDLLVGNHGIVGSHKDLQNALLRQGQDRVSITYL